MLRTCVLSNKLLALIYTDFMYVHMTVVHIWIESPYIIFVLLLYKIFFFRKKYQKYQILILKFVYCRHPVTLLNDSVINTLLLVCFILLVLTFKIEMPSICKMSESKRSVFVYRKKTKHGGLWFFYAWCERITLLFFTSIISSIWPIRIEIKSIIF